MSTFLTARPVFVHEPHKRGSPRPNLATNSRTITAASCVSQLQESSCTESDEDTDKELVEEGYTLSGSGILSLKPFSTPLPPARRYLHLIRRSRSSGVPTSPRTLKVPKTLKLASDSRKLKQQNYDSTALFREQLRFSPGAEPLSPRSDFHSFFDNLKILRENGLDPLRDHQGMFLQPESPVPRRRHLSDHNGILRSSHSHNKREGQVLDAPGNTIRETGRDDELNLIRALGDRLAQRKPLPRWD